jgi:hypothetical protein
MNQTADYLTPEQVAAGQASLANMVAAVKAASVNITANISRLVEQLEAEGGLKVTTVV